MKYEGRDANEPLLLHGRTSHRGFGEPICELILIAGITVRGLSR